MITVVDPNFQTSVFDLSTNKYGWGATNDGDTYFHGEDYTPAVEGDITLSVAGKVRMWGTTTSSLRLYSDDTYGRGAITLEAASGCKIVAIIFDGSSLTFNTTVGTYTESAGKWEGKESTVTLSKGGSTPQIKSITVKYTTPKTYTVNFSNNWASFCAAEKVALPEGVVAYKGAVNGEKLTLTPIDGHVLPAGVGVMLKSTADDAILTESTEETAADFSGNQLLGTTEVTDAPANAYCYSKSQNAFAPVAEGFKIPANKAYLVLGAGAPSRISIVENVATSVENNALNTEVKKVVVNGQMMIIRGGNMFDLNGHLVK